MGSDARPSTRWSARTEGLLAAGLTGLLLLLCSAFGAYELPAPEGAPWTWALWRDPVWHIRLMRLLAAGLVGAALSVGGATIQGLLRNPLAEPYLLGISSGAGVGVRIGLALAASFGLALPLPVSGLAFVGALCAAAAVYLVAQRGGWLEPTTLILAGVIINAFNGALMLGLHLFVNPHGVDTFARWALGAVPDVPSPALLGASAVLILGGWTVCARRATALDTLSLGDDVAASLGARPAALRLELFTVVGLLTAAAVALAGPIGFVGLIVPHICRLAGGPGHPRLVRRAGFAGACLLIAADTLCREGGRSLGVGPIPVGVATALTGAPFFLALLRRNPTRTGANP